MTKHQAKLSGPLRWADELWDVLVATERNHAGRVILFEQEPGQGCSQDTRAIEFRTPGRAPAITHRSAGVAHDIKTHIRLQHVTFDAKAIAAGKEAPVEMPQIVARLVG